MNDLLKRLIEREIMWTFSHGKYDFLNMPKEIDVSKRMSNRRRKMYLSYIFKLTKLTTRAKKAQRVTQNRKTEKFLRLNREYF